MLFYAVPRSCIFLNFYVICCKALRIVNCLFFIRIYDIRRDSERGRVHHTPVIDLVHGLSSATARRTVDGPSEAIFNQWEFNAFHQHCTDHFVVQHFVIHVLQSVGCVRVFAR